MKLLFAIKGLNSVGGGAERIFCLVCSELAARGHEITVLSFDEPGGSSFYSLPSSLDRVDLGLCASTARLSPSNFFRCIPVLRRNVLARSPDVVVGFMHSMFVPLAVALAGTSIPVLASEHTVAQYYSSRPFQYALMQGVTPLLSRITVLSDSIRSSFPALLHRKMSVVPNPVLVPPGEVKLGLEKARHTLLNVGRFDDGKDQATLVCAFAQVADKHRSWDLRLVGDGALRPKLESLVNDLGLNTRVFLPGFRADIELEYGAADIFAISSRYEAFGLVTAEAMSWGLPVIGFADCPGTNELIEDEVTGLLATGGKDRHLSMASQLDRLMSDLTLRQQLGQLARQTMADRFSLGPIIDQWEQLLSDIKMKRCV